MDATESIQRATKYFPLEGLRSAIAEAADPEVEADLQALADVSEPAASHLRHTPFPLGRQAKRDCDGARCAVRGAWCGAVWCCPVRCDARVITAEA